MKAFGTYHPIVLFVYYAAVLLFAMFTMHPVLILSSLAGAVLFFSAMYASRPGVIVKNLIYYLLLTILLAVINPIFSHDGEKILFFLNGNPVTAEAIIYGGAIALMMVAVLFWCKCYNEVMTSDKFLYLFGRAVPKLALILSMAIRFVPLFKNQIGKINQTQKTMGLYCSDSRVDKLKSAFRVFGAILTWSLENAVETADSMKARGYGMKGRSNFSIFQFHKRDAVLVALTCGLSVVIFIGIRMGIFYFQYYPFLTELQTGGGRLWFYLAGGLLMLLPVIIEIKENIQWRLLRSKI